MVLPPPPERSPIAEVGLLTASWVRWLRTLISAVNRVDGFFLADGAWRPPHLADADAANDSTYFSTDASALAYKDSGGTVHALY